MIDAINGETLLQVSIYKISYCSADAVHGNVFAFVSSDNINSPKCDETLICYAFMCQKRKIAQKVTLTVARSFETAYQIWQDAAHRKKFHIEKRHRENERVADENSEISMRNLLIDFSSDITADICNKDPRNLLQNTWVSFDEDVQHSCDFSENTSLPRENSSWDTNFINCS